MFSSQFIIPDLRFIEKSHLVVTDMKVTESEELKKELKKVKKLYKETKFELEFSLYECFLTALCIFMLIPIGLVIYAFIVELGYIDNSPYQYNDSKEVAISNLNENSFNEYFYNSTKTEYLYSPLAFQNALYYGNKFDEELILEYYDDGYKSYDKSHDILSSKYISSLSATDSKYLTKYLKDKLGVASYSMIDKLQVDDENTYTGICHIRTKFALDLKSIYSTLCYVGDIKVKRLNNLTILYLPMEDNLGCYMFLSGENKSENIKDLIRENGVKVSDLNHNLFSTVSCYLEIKPTRLFSSSTNYDMINYIAKERKRLFNNEYYGLNSVNCFEIRASDYYNEEQLSKFSDKPQSLYKNQSLENKVEGIDYIIDENDEIRYNISGITDEEFGEDSDEPTEKEIKKAKTQNNILTTDIKEIFKVDKNYAFTIFDETENKIILMGYRK